MTEKEYEALYEALVAADKILPGPRNAMRKTQSYAKRSESSRKRCEGVRRKLPELKARRINRSGASITLPEPDSCVR